MKKRQKRHDFRYVALGYNQRMKDIELNGVKTKSTCIENGVWYQSAASSLWYQNKELAGDICAIKTDGKTEYLPEPEEKFRARLDANTNSGPKRRR